MQLLTPSILDDDLAAQVGAVAARAGASDGVGPLSESARLALRHPGRHVVAVEGGQVVGYGGRDIDAVEIVVDPASRRRGIGSALLDALGVADARALVWAHGDLPAARAVLTRFGLRPVRDLRRMERSLALRVEDRTAGAPPAGFAARTVVPGADDEALLAVNARAFAHHPEQGSLDLAGLRERMATSWFDPAGLFLVEDVTGPVPRLAAFHWTKTDPADGDPDAGEVYVVGVDPDYQGRGLGSFVTLLGLDHLRARGLRTVELYVDGDNTAAVRTYERLGFEVADTDVQYGH